MCFPYAGAGSTVFHAWPQGSPETYAHVPDDLLESPITILRGWHDACVPAADAAAWQEVAHGPIALHEIGAGHFFVDTHRAWVLRF